MRVTPVLPISFGLVSLTAGIMLVGNSLVDLAPNMDLQIIESRRNLAESLAVQYSALAERDQIETVAFAMEVLAKRNLEILSLALLKKNGTVLAQVGKHAQVWVQPPGEESTFDFFQVPIVSGDQPWGVLQIAFRQADASWLHWFLTDPWVRFIGFVSGSGFLGYFFFMKRTLRQLDPSSVIPTRVKAALDALTQGVVMVDTQALIVLANDAFSRAVGRPVGSLVGSDLSALAWKTIESAGYTSFVYPWTEAIRAKEHRDNTVLLFDLPESETRKFIVNVAPIMDDGSMVRGALVSFHDVTELDHANSQLMEANSELESSRLEILQKNQDLETTNTNLHVEMDHRKKAEAEKDKLYQQLMQASRQAGMADVASSVLHNVGNVLNSINVSTDALLKTLQKPMVDDVCRIASMFHEHQDDLHQFLTGDSKGRQISTYLTLVAESLRGSHQTIQSELGSLQQKVEHVKHVILSQQEIARAGSVREASATVDLMEQALVMALPEPGKYCIHVSREYSHVPLIMTDRHQVLQILVNVVTNAKEAMIERPAHAHRLSVRVGVAGAHKNAVRLEVADTGCGIPAENLPRVFTQGFTTKTEGHGLGLHSAAISAKNMGGSIQIHSGGAGCGATVTLYLPLSRAEAAA